jgi:dihydropteroate synthase
MLYRFGHREYNLGARTHLMGVLNITPDSFSDGGKFYDVGRAVEHGLRMAEEGADFIDIGGESSRPGSEPIPLEEELRRVLPVIENLSRQVTVPLSIDTYKARVAEAALSAGATLVNDISGMTADPVMPSIVSRYGASIVLMHMKGTPRSMQQNPTYVNVTEQVVEFLGTQAQAALDAGVSQVIVDPGIGFGKTLDHNLQLLRDLDVLVRLGFPVLVGPSRKSFIGMLSGLPVAERLEGTAAAVTASILRGAQIVRVHDVKEMKRVAVIADALKPETALASHG